jgi:tRNA (guanine37-N1)-methyltransferase
MKFPRSFDILGNIAIVKFPREFKQPDKKKYAKELLRKNNSVKTVLEKEGKIKGRLRKPTTKWLAGEKTKEVLYKENNCVFRFNVDKTYFSPRLSNERKEIASKIKKNEVVLVMFAGVAPFPIVIAKNSNAQKIYSNEISREANKYAKLNIELNNVKNKIELIPGDIKKVSKKINKKFDVIVMPRPQLKENFLKEAFNLSKKGTRIYYYDFCKADEIKNVAEKIKAEAARAKKKIKILKTKRAGEIAPYKIRVRVDFEVL